MTPRQESFMTKSAIASLQRESDRQKREIREAAEKRDEALTRETLCGLLAQHLTGGTGALPSLLSLWGKNLCYCACSIHPKMQIFRSAHSSCRC
eukprot:5173469-Amphidinium_carterae.1